MSQSNPQIIVLGAGIAGLTAATHLNEKGYSVLLLDKGRGVGGRVATRRVKDFPANHGAPCFRLDRPDVVQVWKNALASVAFTPAPLGLDPRAYVCAEGISQLPKALAKGLTVKLETTVTQIERQQDLWRLSTSSGETWEAPKLLITAPLPQAAAFFRTTDKVLEQRILHAADTVRYSPQWTAIVSWETGLGPEIETSYLRLAEGEAMATIHEQVPRKIWVIHASRTWTEQHLEAEATTIVSTLSQELMRHFPEAKPFVMQAHRWRFARTERPLEQSFMDWADRPGLALAGDFCLESSLMGAAQSALTWAMRQ